MFKAVVESHSHEGGLLAPFTGSSPALGSIIVRVDDGTYIGKIDGVLGNTDSPIAHIAHLDRKINPDSFLGCEAQIRPKTHKQDESRQQSNRYENRDRRDNRRSRDRDSNRRDSRRGNFRDRDSNRRDSRRGNFRDRDSNRRDSGRGNFRDRDSNRRDSGRGNFRDRDSRNNRSHGREKKIFADNDWTCAKCNNSNFSFRKECNRCGEPKGSNSGGGNNRDRRDNRPRNNRSSRNDGEPRKFRKAKGKSANHAHNRGPKPLDVRSRRRNRDD
ncbi:MAG: hypothetical protein CMA92_05955 [Euryarchaeota archaeon]|nr:hypothetical protein [Euryarchaeota archaeon]